LPIPFRVVNFLPELLLLLLFTEHYVDQNTVDYSLANPDTLTKYKTAAQITHKVLDTVTGAITSNPLVGAK
jgi:hypothetical protein